MPGVTADSTVVMVDSSPQRTSSAESNFRELDDAYLQTQARIWLGEVLQIRFDEQIDISDLLADGELLFEVAEVISRMLPTLSVDESQIKVYEWKTLASNKSTRRYMPYYNVDSFLRMCKNLGIDGIDLFTPSDVVESRNTRKVCMCLRSLSKKSRLRDLNVPDFDSVTCTLAMPTDMVECIRKSLEKSQSSSSLSVEQEAEKVSRVRVWRRMSNSVSAVSNGYSDNCDEAESKFVVAESYGSSDDAYDAESPKISGSQVVREYNSELQLSTKSDFKNEDDDLCEYLSPSNAESVGSPCSQYYSDEDLSMPSSNGLGSRISGKVPELNSETNHEYQISDVTHVPIDWGDVHLDVGNYKGANANDGEVDCVSHNKEDVDTTCSYDIYLIGNDMCNEHLGTSNNPSKVDCDNSSELGEPPECVVTDDFHAGEAPYLNHEDAPSDHNATKHDLFVCEVGPGIGEPYSHGKTNDKVLSGELLIQSSRVSKPSENPNFLYDSENQASNACTEVINIGENSCCDRLNDENATSEDVAGQLRFHEEHFPRSVDYDGHNYSCSNLLAVKSNGYDDHRIPARFVAPTTTSIPSLLERDTVICTDLHCSPIESDKESLDDNKITPDYTEQHSDNSFMDGNASNSSDMPHMDLNSSPYMVVAKNSAKCSKYCDDTMDRSEGHNALVESVDDKPIDIDNTILVSSFAAIACDPQPEAQHPKIGEGTNHKHLQSVEEAEKGELEFVKQEGTNKEVPVHKPQRKLVKSVVKGTALVGVAVFLLYLRKNRRDNTSEAKKRPTRFVIQGTTKPLQKGQMGGSSSCVYPAEKLHLKM